MGVFSKKTLALKPLTQKELIASGLWLKGDQAIKTVEAMEGELSDAQKLIVGDEGFVSVPYLDSKGVVTIGAGLTEEFMTKSFKDAFSVKEKLIRSEIPEIDKLPKELKDLLISSAYRGGITGSPETIKLINKGDFDGAALEFLVNQEFNNAPEDSGIKERMSKLAGSLARHAKISPNPVVPPKVEENVAPMASQGPSEGLTDEEKEMFKLIQQRDNESKMSSEELEMLRILNRRETNLKTKAQDSGLEAKSDSITEAAQDQSLLNKFNKI